LELAVFLIEILPEKVERKLKKLVLTIGRDGYQPTSLPKRRRHFFFKGKLASRVEGNSTYFNPTANISK